MALMLDPTLDHLNSQVRLNPKIIRLPSVISPDEIEESIREVIHTKFFDHLVLAKVDDCKWIVKTRNISFMYGFSIVLINNTVVLSHAVNTWSLWMQDYTRESLCSKLHGQIVSKKGITIPDFDSIDTFLSWLRLKADTEDQNKIIKFYMYQLNKIPTEFRNMEDSSILI